MTSLLPKLKTTAALKGFSNVFCFSLQKAPRAGLNSALLLQKRHLGLLPGNSYSRYGIKRTHTHVRTLLCPL